MFQYSKYNIRRRNRNNAYETTQSTVIKTLNQEQKSKQCLRINQPTVIETLNQEQIVLVWGLSKDKVQGIRWIA